MGFLVYSLRAENPQPRLMIAHRHTRTFAPRVLRAIYADELKRLDGYAREHRSHMSWLHAVRGMSDVPRRDESV